MSILGWRRIHSVASGLLCVLATVHSTLTPFLYAGWSPDAVWFLGSGMGLLLLGLLNLAHVGTEPCRTPSARLVRWANWAFLLLGVGALLAVPEPQAYMVVLSLAGQAVAGRWTLPGRT